MKHYTAEDWIDYVRNVQATDVAAQMKSHLQDCDECQANFRMWSAVNQAAANGADYAPPDHALRVARSMFRPAGESSGALSGWVAKLLFDSAQQPVTVGVRGSATICRQLLYQYGHRFIDLRVEKQTTKNELCLTGQIQETTGQPDSIPVVLYCGDQAIQHTNTNAMGEFQMAFTPAKDLHIEIDVKEKKIRVRVPEVSETTN